MPSLFACFSGPQGGDDWVPRHSYGDYATAVARSRVLVLVEEEVDQCFASLPFAPRSSHEAVPLQRLFNANLPRAELAAAKQLLHKLATMRSAQEVLGQENKRLLQELKEAEKARRRVEFARARADALAMARGEALAGAQQAHREAEQRLAQLFEAHKQALERLGVEITPNKPAADAPLLTPTGILVSDSTAASLPAASQHAQQQEQAAGWRTQPAAHELLTESPEHVRGVRGRQQAAAGARSVDAAAQDGQQAEQAGQLRRSAQSAPAAHARASRSSAPVAHSQELSGFTVYSNELSPDFQGEGRGLATPELDAEDEAGGAMGQSHVAWRDISAAASASLSGDEEWQGQAWCGTGSRPRSAHSAPSPVRGTRSPVRVRQHEEPAEPTRATAALPDRRAVHAARLARLVLPHLHASQLDSLVRIGASMASPPEAGALSSATLQKLLPPFVWHSGVQPEELLHHLQMEAAEAWQDVRSSRAGSDPLPEGRAAGGADYSPDMPGAGTWVSPTLSAQLHARALAAGAGFAERALAAEPSPPAHIKAVRAAVFKGDMEFYNALGAGLKAPSTATLADSYASGQAGVAPAPGALPQAPKRSAPAPAAPVAPAAAPGRLSVASAGGRASVASARLPPLAAGPAVARSTASLSRQFQPLGMAHHAAAPAAVAAPAPLAVSGGALQREARCSADENGRYDAGYLPPPTKRSLDSINTSIEAAIALLGPQQPVPRAQNKLGGSAGALVQQPARAPPRHARGASMPPALEDSTNGWR